MKYLFEKQLCLTNLWKIQTMAFLMCIVRLSIALRHWSVMFSVATSLFFSGSTFVCQKFLSVNGGSSLFWEFHQVLFLALFYLLPLALLVGSDNASCYFHVGGPYQYLLLLSCSGCLLCSSYSCLLFDIVSLFEMEFI